MRGTLAATQAHRQGAWWALRTSTPYTAALITITATPSAICTSRVRPSG
jgi:hypothetical protein